MEFLKILKGEYTAMNMCEIQDTINGINKYLLNSNAYDFRIKSFDGSRLYLIGSFDLCYYHTIEMVFHEVFKISMETMFSVDLRSPLLHFKIEADIVCFMRCELCNQLNQIDGFGGYSHFLSTKQALDKNIKNRYMRIQSQTQYETVYECTACHKKWKLAEPDFPVAGYFIPE